VESGELIPDGIRQDENDFVLVHLINLENVAGGINDILVMKRYHWSAVG